MRICRSALALSVLPALAACSSDGSPGEPVVTTVAGRPGAAESRGGEPAGFTVPAPTQPVPVEPAAGATSNSGDSPSGSPEPGDVDSGEPASEAGATISTEPLEVCHPAYYPCLPDLPGDALDCSGLDDDLKPVVVLDPADDPYRLDADTSGRACNGAGLAGLVGEGPRADAPGDVSRSSGGSGPDGDALPPRRTPSSSWIPDPEPPDVENVAAVCGPGTEPSGQPPAPPEPVGVSPESPPAASADSVGAPAEPDVFVPDSPSVGGDASLPEPDGNAPEPDGELSEPAGASPEPDGESSEPGGESPEPGGESPEPGGDSEPGVPLSESPESGVADPTLVAEYDEWCLPEITGDTVRLFWCEDDVSMSSDLEVYEESGPAPTYRTTPLALRVGTRIERYSTCTGLNAVEEVIGFVELTANAVDEPLIGVHLCGRFFLGEDLYAWGLGLYRAWQDSEGRYRIEMPSPVEYLDTC